MQLNFLASPRGDRSSILLYPSTPYALFTQRYRYSFADLLLFYSAMPMRFSSLLLPFLLMNLRTFSQHLAVP